MYAVVGVGSAVFVRQKVRLQFVGTVPRYYCVVLFKLLNIECFKI